MRPVLCRWNGHAFEPEGDYHLRRAAEDYEHDQVVRLAPVEERSSASHRHQFAWLKTAWESLPERYAGEPWAQSPEHLRKYALIRTGFATTVETVCDSNATAMRVATMARSLDEYAVAEVDGRVIRVHRARSQSNRAMNKQDFEASKAAILNFIAGLIEVDPETLARQSEAA